LLHHVYFNFLDLVPTTRCFKPLGADRFRAVLERVRPDVVLSVHDHLNHAYFDYARAVLGRDRVRCVTYCDELHGGYGFSHQWVDPEADLFIGVVPETCEAAVRWGMVPEKTFVGGFMTRRFFYKADGNAPCSPREFTLLLMASGHGAQNHIVFLEALKRRRVDAKVLALCGASAEAARAVIAWAAANPSLPVQVLPHDTDIGQLMRSVSAVVARPGAGVCSEAIVSRCPLLINTLGGLMPQELINVKFFRKHNIANVIHRPDDLARVAAEWKANPSLPETMRQRMDAACPHNGPMEILRKIAEMKQSSCGT
jgi:processive 1,2-diacylglycerol beta-glucosyltransferase